MSNHELVCPCNLDTIYCIWAPEDEGSFYSVEHVAFRPNLMKLIMKCNKNGVLPKLTQEINHLLKLHNPLRGHRAFTLLAPKTLGQGDPLRLS